MTKRRAVSALAVASAIASTVALACTDKGPDPPADGPSFPADYAKTYREVRGCRQSGDHDLNRMRVLADPAALDAYRLHDRPIPAGAIVLKEEFDIADTTCSGPIKQWTAMKRLAAGSSASTLDWRWEQVDADRNVIGTDAPRCYGCHKGCTPDAGGYENTCTLP